MEPALLILVTLIGGFCGFVWGARYGWKDKEQDAVDSGYAEWVVDQETGETTCEWKVK